MMPIIRLAIAFLLFSSASAYAGTNLAAPGTACQFRYNNQTSAVHTNDGLYNGTAKAQEVHCPLQVQGYYSQNAAGGLRYRRFTSGDLKCRLLVQFFDGSVKLGDFSSTGNSNQKTGLLIIPRVEFDKAAAGFVISCTLPPSTYINSYYLGIN